MNKTAVTAKTAEQILAERRAGDKKRFQKWKDKQDRAGNRHISGMVSSEVYNLICVERDRNKLSVSTILERAVTALYGAHGQESKPVQETLTIPFEGSQQDVIPTTITADKMILSLRKLKIKFEAIANHLNEYGILDSQDAEWTKESIKQQFKALTKK